MPRHVKRLSGGLRWSLAAGAIGVLITMPAVAGGQAGSGLPECSPYNSVIPARFDAPWPAPTRNPGIDVQVGAQLAEIEDGDDRRTGHTLEVTDEWGGVVYSGRMDRIPGVARAIYKTVELATDEVRSYRAQITETWETWEGACKTTRVRDFVAGGGPINPGPTPALRVKSTLNGRSRAAGLARGERSVVGRLAFDVTLVCRVVDDGLGNGVYAPRTLWVAIPGRSGLRADLCPPYGPSDDPPGTTWTEQATYRSPLSIGVGGPMKRSLLWRISLQDWPKPVHGGTVEVRRTNYRPERWTRVFNHNFDAYFNTCVKGAREVWASGGWVYCNVRSALAQARVSMALRRK